MKYLNKAVPILIAAVVVAGCGGTSKTALRLKAKMIDSSAPTPAALNAPLTLSLGSGLTFAPPVATDETSYTQADALSAFNSWVEPDPAAPAPTVFLARFTDNAAAITNVRPGPQAPDNLNKRLVVAVVGVGVGPTAGGPSGTPAGSSVEQTWVVVFDATTGVVLEAFGYGTPASLPRVSVG